ncbi:HNH endonuclease signature motif containing protein [Georgenia daeguensis]|uniref:DUF222 domain-containing protein n=1 Tax=Georgenia daeguensis TaxID=908355 RepID=A0ABP8ETS9_9MICO
MSDPRPLANPGAGPLTNPGAGPLADPGSGPLANAGAGPLAEASVPVLAALAAATAHLDTLAGADLAALPPADLLAAVDATEALHRRVQALTARVLTAAETDGMWATTGARTFPAWYRARTGRHHSTAHSAVRTARRLRDHLPGTTAALGAGRISADHATALTTHAAATPATRARLTDPELGEEFLLSHATTLGATEFTHLVKHWAHRADPAADDRAYRHDSQAEHLTLAPTTDGYHLAGWLSTANGQALQTALDARTGTPAATDPRTPAQRRAHALTSLARLTLDAGILQPGARIRPHLAVHVPYDTLRRLIDANRPTTCTTDQSADQRPAGPPGTAFGLDTGTAPSPGTAGPGQAGTFVIPAALDHNALVGTEPATLADGTPIAPQLLARLACQGNFHRVIFGPDSQILDSGREERLFTAAQTRAIIARDRTCRYPDCHAPPGEGEIHHSLWWYDQHGPTAAHLGILLCWYHHDHVHQHDITIERTGDHWTFTRPDGTTITTIRTAA